MAVEIGSRGLEEVNLVIPQSTSLTFDVVHKDGKGNVIDHSESTAHMAFQSKDKNVTYVMDSCCDCSAEQIRVTIPASMTDNLPTGKLKWDLIVTTASGEQICVCYGIVTVHDTYAMDEV